MPIATTLRLFIARMQIADPRTGLPTAEMVRTGEALLRRVGGSDAPLPGTLYVADADGSMRPLAIGSPGQVLTVNATGDGVEWQ